MKYIVDMPDWFNPIEPITVGLESVNKALAGAKKAEKVKWIDVTQIYPVTCWEVNGKKKQVKLYAVKEAE